MLVPQLLSEPAMSQEIKQRLDEDMQKFSLMWKD